MIVLANVSAYSASAGESTNSTTTAAVWLDNYDEALKQSKATGHPILADFSGSDWCLACKALEKEVFSQAAFASYAKDSLVLLSIDFPMEKEQTDAIKEQNQKLNDKFEIDGYPTILILDADGKELARTQGYQPGGPEKYVELIKSLISAKPISP